LVAFLLLIVYYTTDNQLKEDLKDDLEEDTLTLKERMQQTLWERILNFIRYGTY